MSRLVFASPPRTPRKPNAVTGRRSNVRARISSDGGCVGYGEYEVDGQKITGDYFGYVEVFNANGKPIDHGEAIFFGTGPIWVSHEETEEFSEEGDGCRPAGIAHVMGTFYPHAIWRGGTPENGQVTVGSTLARIAESQILSVSAVPGRPDEADLLGEFAVARNPLNYTASEVADLCEREEFSLDVTLADFPGRRFRIGPDWTARELTPAKRRPQASRAPAESGRQASARSRVSARRRPTTLPAPATRRRRGAG